MNPLPEQLLAFKVLAIAGHLLKMAKAKKKLAQGRHDYHAHKAARRARQCAYREANREAIRAKQQAERAEISDGYARKLLLEEGLLKRREITPAMVNMKREALRLKRALWKSRKAGAHPFHP